jgi:hypothetical protein
MTELLPLLTLLLVLPLAALHAEEAPRTLDHSAWDQMLKTYVRADHRVDYARWSEDGVEALDTYLATLAQPFPEGISADEKHAAMINAYNALTIRHILNHFPKKSIWKTKKPFTAQRHNLNGKLVSLDDIETELRKTVGPRTHSILVCAARSCPPLRREAYLAQRLEEQLEDNTRAWLADEQLNRFDAGKKEADVSTIFKWYRDDFEENGLTLEKFLAQYAPEGTADFLLEKGYDIDFQKYDWGLNDTGDVGKNYRGFYWDYLRNK